jgi:hypothetical protein
MGLQGWIFREGEGVVPDPNEGVAVLHELYTRSDRRYSRASGGAERQGKAVLDDLALAEAEGLAEVVEPGLTAVIKPH